MFSLLEESHRELYVFVKSILTEIIHAQEKKNKKGDLKPKTLV